LNRLAGKRAIVIGAGSVGPGWGNGKATAVLMAREGARVLAVDRNPEAAAETVALIVADGGSADAFAGDMTSPEAAEAAVARALALWDGIDILHFNIGTSQQGGILDGDARELAHDLRRQSRRGRPCNPSGPADDASR
jgi:NAD(P)-dependent dehydrogenase (short-subunit alcohol dehydrogenase family)